MMILKKNISLFFLVIAMATGSAQDGVITSLTAQFNRYTENNLTEKIYLHTDRNFYIPGEMVWFKAYLLNAATHTLSTFSKVAYVDVLDENNKPALQAKISIQKGTGNGSLYLPLTLGTGAYKIRAYTSWMKNFDAAFFFEKRIQVVNTFMSAGLPPVDSSDKTDLQFLPEGGSLLQAVENRVAFKITGANGKGLDQFSGIVLTDRNDTILKFTSYKFGIGTFLLTPQPGLVYRAQITTAAGKKYIKELPLSNERGYSMRTSVSSGRLFIEVNGKPPSNAGNQLYMLAHTHGVLKKAEAKMLENNKAVFIIPEKDLGEGISHITVFNSNRQPVCERLYFRNPEKKLDIAAAPSDVAYGPRKKITVDIACNNMPDLSAANLSMAVYRIDSLQKESPDNITSYFWLSSDIKGSVENPRWYLNDTDSSKTGLDNVMLTHGWRRFYWQDVQQNTAPAFTFLPEIDGHIIYGKVLDSATQKPISESPVYLSIPGLYTQFYGTLSDKQGQFKFYTRNVLGQGELMLQADAVDQINSNIEIQSPFSDQYSTKKVSSLTIDPSIQPWLEKASLNAQVQRKYAWEFIKNFHLPDIDTSAFYGKPDERYRLDDYTRFTTMEEVLREYVLGVLVGRSGGKFKLTMLDAPNNRLFRDNPLVLLDGVPVLNMDKILAYDPLKVSRIELVKRRYYYGPLMFDGIVNMITYKGNMDGFPVDPKAVILDYDGLQMQREFYSPVYETEPEINNHIADYRNLLYWAPDINIAANGKAHVIFYSSDVKAKYKAVIEGISSDGIAGTQSFDFEIK